MTRQRLSEMAADVQTRNLAPGITVLATTNFAATFENYFTLRNIFKCKLNKFFRITFKHARHTWSAYTYRPRM